MLCASGSASCRYSWETADDGLSAWAPATQVGDLDGITISWLLVDHEIENRPQEGHVENEPTLSHKRQASTALM